MSLKVDGAKYYPVEEARTEIRVLVVEPASRPQDPLVGTLLYSKLSEARYIALSYAWGQQDEDRRNIAIRCPKPGTLQLLGLSRGKTHYHSIGSNLAAALRHLRERFGKVSVWADALCINQKDSKEKGWQVPLMKDIYSKALEVNAWLGPRYNDDVRMVDSTYAAFDLAETIWKTASQFRGLGDMSEDDWLEASTAVAKLQSSPTETSGPWYQFAVDLRTEVLSDHSLHARIRHLRELSKNEYFSRMWVLQETGRARRLTFNYSSSSDRKSRILPYQYILLALGLAHSLHADEADLGVKDLLRGFDGRWRACLTARTTCAKGAPLLEVLMGAYFISPPRHQASDERDLIYARMGLAGDSTGIKARYELDLALVYAEVSQFLLLKGAFETLVDFKPYRFQNPLVTKGLPSWAFDWTRKGSHTFNDFKASGNTTQKAHFVSCPQSKFKQGLRMTGVNLGAIYHAEESFSALVSAAGLREANIVQGSILAAPESFSTSRKDEVVDNIKLTCQRLNHNCSERCLASITEFPTLRFAYFWAWWLRWVERLINIIGIAESLQSQAGSQNTYNISELLFRKAPTEFRNAATGREFGTKSGLRDLIDYDTWLKRSQIQHSQQGRAATDIAMAFAQSLFVSAWGMRPAVLECGRIGLVPEETKAQDEVVILHGVKAPLVVRRRTKELYSIVGPAHICGVMQGEAMTFSLPTEIFKLV